MKLEGISEICKAYCDLDYKTKSLVDELIKYKTISKKDLDTYPIGVINATLDFFILVPYRAGRFDTSVQECKHIQKVLFKYLDKKEHKDSGFILYVVLLVMLLLFC